MPPRIPAATEWPDGKLPWCSAGPRTVTPSFIRTSAGRSYGISAFSPFSSSEPGTAATMPAQAAYGRCSSSAVASANTARPSPA